MTKLNIRHYLLVAVIGVLHASAVSAHVGATKTGWNDLAPEVRAEIAALKATVAKLQAGQVGAMKIGWLNLAPDVQNWLITQTANVGALRAEVAALTAANVTESPNGIWVGTLSFDGGINSGICLIASTLELNCVGYHPTTGVVASVSTGHLSVVDGNHVIGTGISYATLGNTFADGSTVANFAISDGTVSARDTLSLTLAGGGTAATVSAAFHISYDRDSSLATVAGSYTGYLMDGTVFSFSINASGVISASGPGGCIGNGQVSVIDPQFNEYDVQLTVSSCPGADGTYNGLGLMADTSTTNDTFLITLFSATKGEFAQLLK